MIKKQLHILALTIVLTIAGAIHSFACRCDGEATVAASLKYADVVFSGQVIATAKWFWNCSISLHPADCVVKPRRCPASPAFYALSAELMKTDHFPKPLRCGYISRTLTTNYDSLGVVVTGDTSKMPFNWREWPTAVVNIKVDKMYKGQMVSNIITILTPPNGAGCGYAFKVGQQYIVYATLFDETLLYGGIKRRSLDDKTCWTHQCTRTQVWNATEENDIIKEMK